MIKFNDRALVAALYYVTKAGMRPSISVVLGSHVCHVGPKLTRTQMRIMMLIRDHLEPFRKLKAFGTI